MTDRRTQKERDSKSNFSKITETVKNITLILGLVTVIIGWVSSWYKSQMVFQQQIDDVQLKTSEKFGDMNGRVRVLEYQITNELKRIYKQMDKMENLVRELHSNPGYSSNPGHPWGKSESVGGHHGSGGSRHTKPSSPVDDILAKVEIEEEYEPEPPPPDLVEQVQSKVAKLKDKKDNKKAEIRPFLIEKAN